MMDKKIILFILSIGFLKAQEIDSAKIYLQTANTALSKGEYQIAIENYKSVLRFRPEHTAVTYNIACCYSLLNNKPEALKWLNKAIELGLYVFDEDEDFNNIRETKEYKKLLNKANKLLKQMMQTKPEPVIIIPSDYDTNKTYPLLICMHGWGSNPIDLSKNFQKIPDLTGYILCCPYGPQIMGRTSFGWGERDSAERRIRETIEYIQDRYKIDKERIILLGFSQGGMMAYYIGLKNVELFKGVIPIAGFYDTTFNQYLNNAKDKKIKFVIMLGADEPEYRTQANLDGLNKLVKAGIGVSFQVYAGYGHTIPGDIDFEIRRAIEWVEK